METIIALVIAALPFVAVAVVIVGVVALAVLLIAFFQLLEKPIRYWLLYLSVVLDAFVLIPIAVAAKVVAGQDPALWASAKTTTLVFSAMLLVPTLLVWMYCKKR